MTNDGPDTELPLLPPPVLPLLLVNMGLVSLPSTILKSDMARDGTSAEYVLKDDFTMAEVTGLEFKFLSAVPNLSSTSDLFKANWMI